MSTDLKVDTLIDPDKALNDANINEATLNDEFIRQPGLFFYYVSQHARAEKQHASLKLSLEAVEAKAATKVRLAAQEAGEKLTADMVKERVRLHPTVVRTEQAVIDAKQVETILKGMVEAMRHKKDMLIVKGNMTRDELKARISVESGLAGNQNSTVRDHDAAVKQRLANNQSVSVCQV